MIASLGAARRRFPTSSPERSCDAHALQIAESSSMKAAFIPAALLCCVVGASSAPAKAKVLVVYYSQSNHTQSLAQAVADGAAQHADVVDVRGPLSIDNGKALRAALRAASPTTRPLIPVSHPRTHAYPVCFVRAFVILSDPRSTRSTRSI